jgi:hypothetical protein
VAALGVLASMSERTAWRLGRACSGGVAMKTRQTRREARRRLQGINMTPTSFNGVEQQTLVKQEKQSKNKRLVRCGFNPTAAAASTVFSL